jgi:hypothetical protein
MDVVVDSAPQTWTRSDVGGGVGGDSTGRNEESEFEQLL